MPDTAKRIREILENAATADIAQAVILAEFPEIEPARLDELMKKERRNDPEFARL